MASCEQCDFVDSYLAEDAFVTNKKKQLQQTKDRLEKVDAILGGRSITDIGNDAFNDLMPVENSSLMTLDTLAKNLADTNDNLDTPRLTTSRNDDAGKHK